ncbi:MAG: DUF4412 domain-containing protein, partial [Bacteroidota bacterium]
TLDDDEASDEPQGEVSATGRTNMIEGYRCKEYKYEDKETIGYTWMAEDFPLNYGELFGFVNFSNTKNGNSGNYSDVYDMTGSPLESISTNKKTGEKFVWKMRNIQIGVVDKDLFSLEGYEAMDMSRFSDLFDSDDQD